MRLIGIVVAFLVWFVAYGAIVIAPGGFGLYTKTRFKACLAICILGESDNIERRVINFNYRFKTLIIGYNENDGIRFFEGSSPLP